ncbi:MAG: HAMP domain-containing histidine kinase [Oscillospiraceae bacterium]|nr:HAMP domain-containing histidine kinase [Oscillospiraceae bacterium]
MKTKNLSIRLRIFLSMIGFSAILLGILWIFQILFLEDFYKLVKTWEIRADAAAIGGYVTRGQWDELSGAIAVREDLYVEVWGLDTGAWVVSGNFTGGVQFRLSAGEKARLYEEIREKGGVVIRRYARPELIGLRRRMGESILHANIISGKDGGSWMIMVSANISPVGATTDTLRYQIYIISAVMVIAAVIVALTISHRVTQPIQRLNTAAGKLAKGDYTAEFEAGGYSEIARLAHTLTTAARELGKTESIRRELIANVSHDLRTPLTLITGYSEMMRDIPGENTPENIGVIAEEAKRLSALVNDMLELSGLQENSSAPVMARFSLTQCIDEIIRRVAAFTGKDGYEIAFEADGEAEVSADRSRIEQAVYNLLANAIHYTGDDRRVLVRQTIDSRYVTIEVLDSGEGIDEENLPYIWDRYFKLDKVHKRAAVGTGLGLSIVKSILDQHTGASYGVQSKPGEGSCFWFRLRLA